MSSVRPSRFSDRGRDSSGGKLQALVYILLSTTAVFSYAIGPRKLSANEQFFVGAQTVVSLLQTTQIISDVCFITDHVQIKPKSFESRRNSFPLLFFNIFFFFFFFTRGGCISCLRACFGARLLLQSY